MAQIRLKYFYGNELDYPLKDLTIKATSAKNTCLICDRKSYVLKTQSKICYSHDFGKFKLTERILFCKEHKYTGRETNEILKYHSDLATEIAEKGFKVTFDLLVKVGLMRYSDYMRLEDIKIALKHGIAKLDLSISTIALISKRFLEYCKLLHKKYEYKIREEIEKNGGYFLHFDSTTEEKSGILNFVIMDSLSGNILHSSEIKTENYANIVWPLKEIREKYGSPLATHSDLKAGFLSTCSEVFQWVLHIFCHYHFLRTFKDFFTNDYNGIKTQISNWKLINDLSIQSKMVSAVYDKKIMKKLAEIEAFFNESKDVLKTYYYVLLWILNFKKESNGKGMPFDLPYLDFYLNLEEGRKFLDKIFKKADEKELERYKSFNTIVTRIDGNSKNHKEFREAISNLKYMKKHFNKLRSILYLSAKDDKKSSLAPLSKEYNLTEEEVKTIPENIRKYLEELNKEISESKKEEKIKMLTKFEKQIDKYKDNLKIPIIEITTKEGKKKIIPPRTNNFLENFFRENKRIIRKQTGKKNLTREFASVGDLLPYYVNMNKSKIFKDMFKNEKTLINEFANLRKPENFDFTNVITFPNETDFYFDNYYAQPLNSNAILEL